MKKFLITIAPFCAILFVLMLISLGLKGVLTFFIALFVTIVIAIFIAKWVEFVDKHIKD